MKCSKTLLIAVPLLMFHTPAAFAESEVPTHVLTATPLGGYQGRLPAGPGQPYSMYAPYLSWAVWTDLDNAAAIHAQGIRIFTYTDPNRIQPATSVSAADPMYNDDESTFAHDCAGNRIYNYSYPDAAGPRIQYLMEPHSNVLLELWRDYIQPWNDSGVIDAIQEDDAAPDVAYNNTLPCNFDQAEWSQASVARDEGLGFPIIYNGLGITRVGGVYTGSPSIVLNQAPNVIGAIAEGCYSENSNPPLLDSDSGFWNILENQEIETLRAGKLFFCLVRQPDGMSQIETRMYATASFLLTYDINYGVLWEPNESSASNFHVYPESQLVLLDPAVPTPTDVAELQSFSGVYVREYSSCYYQGQRMGSCAVAVNASSRTLSFPLPGKYSSTVVLHGDGVLDGGSLTIDGPVPDSMGPLSALIAFGPSLPTPSPSPSPGPAPAPIPSPSFSISGSVENVFSGGLLLQTGATCGYLYVYTDSGTTYSPQGYAPIVGDIVSASGAGDCNTSINATLVIGPGGSTIDAIKPSVSVTSPVNGSRISRGISVTGL